MKKTRTIACLLLLCLMLAPLTAAAQEGSANYIYSPHEEELPVPPAYLWQRSITASQLPGVDSLVNLRDCHVSQSAVYVLMQDKLLVFDSDLTLKQAVSAYQDAGEDKPLSDCSGLFVNPDGSLYIAQADKSQILHLNQDFSLARVLGRPAIDGFDNVNYRPTKLVVDEAGRLYVVAKGMYEGIVELQPDGRFSRFYGVNAVRFTAADLLWRRIATPEQRARQRLWLPTDFTNLAIDREGFIFATVMASRDHTIKRLNAKGQNILKVAEFMKYPDGDLSFPHTGYGIPVGKSQFVAVDTNASGVFIALDAVRSRVFAYNEDGQLLFIFGGSGDRQGYFRSPVDVDFLGDKIIVLDQMAQSIEVFAPTAYGEALNRAVSYQHQNQFDKAADSWREVLQYNHQMSLAYSGIGRALIRSGDNRQALGYLQRGNDREYYSKAYALVRNEDLRQHFDKIVPALALVVVGALVLSRVRAKRRREREVF